MIRNHGEEFNTLGEEVEGVVDQQGSPSQVGGPVQSSSSLPRPPEPVSAKMVAQVAYGLFWTFYICTES